MVCGDDDIGVVLDDDDGMACVAEFEDGFEEFLDIAEVEAGGGLVEEVEGVGRAGFGNF